MQAFRSCCKIWCIENTEMLLSWNVVKLCIYISGNICLFGFRKSRVVKCCSHIRYTADFCYFRTTLFIINLLGSLKCGLELVLVSIAHCIGVTCTERQGLWTDLAENANSMTANPGTYVRLGLWHSLWAIPAMPSLRLDGVQPLCIHLLTDIFHWRSHENTLVFL